MSEVKRIIDQHDRALHGGAWHGDAVWEILRGITPEQAFIAICQDELIKMMGPVDTELRWAKKGPTGIMMVGLQGSIGAGARNVCVATRSSRGGRERFLRS